MHRAHFLRFARALALLPLSISASCGRSELSVAPHIASSVADVTIDAADTALADVLDTDAHTDVASDDGFEPCDALYSDPSFVLMADCLADHRHEGQPCSTCAACSHHEGPGAGEECICDTAAGVWRCAGVATYPPPDLPA
jgi:hypothetical protein